MFMCFILLIFWLKGGFSAISSKAPRKGKPSGSKREGESHTESSSSLSAAQRRFEAAQNISRPRPYGSTAADSIDKRTDTLDDVKRELNRLQEM
jgi:hypothetical protein